MDGGMITLGTMQRLWPHGDTKVPGLIEGIVDAAPAVFQKYGLTTNFAVAHALAQFSHECGAGTEMVENIHYSPERAAQVWPLRENDPHPERHFANAGDCLRKTGSYAGDPDFPGKLIDLVYGTRMGNRPGTHDGRNFIGRGLAQTTGREGYEKLAAKTGFDLVSHPELTIMPSTALECGVADFVLCGCLPFAFRDDVSNVTLHLNGGYVGLAERKQWLGKWKAALLADAPKA